MVFLFFFFFASVFFLTFSFVLHKITVKQHTRLLAHLESLILEGNMVS